MTDHNLRKARFHRSKLWLLVLWVLGLLLGMAAPAQAQVADPRLPWFTADSAHFRVHYREGQRAQADAVARAAERVYPRVTQALSWEPRSRTEVVLFSEWDLANGWSTPIPFNHMGIYLTPPDDSELLENSAWLDLLLVHEFTHTVHLDKRRGAPGVLQSIFGRVLWFIPNLFQPGWPVEGLAVWHESDPASGRGRLRGPVYEAWLRAERKAGFIKLAEINSDGRALPLSKHYLYGAYFYEFVARKYGRDKAYQIVEQYSGNIVPRLHSAPWGATGKMMDELWEEFLADLARQVDDRAAPIVSQQEQVGVRLTPTVLELDSVASLPSGEVLAVVDDGVGAPTLQRFGRDGARQDLVSLNRGARLDVSANGTVLVAQPDLCDAYRITYDLYRLEGRRLLQLTHCAHLRRAVSLGGAAAAAGADPAMAAIQLDAGRSRVVALAADGRETARLFEPPAGHEVVDLAAAPDGRRLAVLTRLGSDWRVVEVDLTAAAANAASAGASSASPSGLNASSSRLILHRSAPLSNLRYGAAGLEMLAVENGQINVWRLGGAQGAAPGATQAGGSWQRLTHAHTAVSAHGGTAADGSLAVAVVAPQGFTLHRVANAQPLQSLAVGPDGRVAGGTTLVAAGLPASAIGTAGLVRGDETPTVAGSGANAPAPAQDPVLGEARSYSALSALYPRSWFPSYTVDRGLKSLGASTSGADATGWHQYVAYGLWETTQRELLGGLEYLYLGRHGLALDRSLVARAWTGAAGSETTTQYDRKLQAQWLSLFPVPGLNRLAHRVNVGLGAALERTDRVNLSTQREFRWRDERLLAGLLDYDSRGSNWYADGVNRGQHVSLLAETHKPFKADARDQAPDLNGTVIRGDARAYFGIGRTALALRWTEARARSGLTSPFQMGGALESTNTIGFNLNRRELPLRGYAGDEAELLGANARLFSMEWRTPLVDIDRHGMVPPVGINRLAGTVFFDAGRTWDDGTPIGRYRRSVGVELRGEIKLLYVLGLDMRLGVAQALDPLPGRSKTQGYLTLGQSF